MLSSTCLQGFRDEFSKLASYDGFAELLLKLAMPPMPYGAYKMQQLARGADAAVKRVGGAAIPKVITPAASALGKAPTAAIIDRVGKTAPVASVLHSTNKRSLAGVQLP